MKKYLFLLVAIGLGFTACEGPMGPEGPPGPVNMQTLEYFVAEQDWVLMGGANQTESYFEYTFKEPFLTDDIYNFGVVVGYYYHIDTVNGKEYLSGLPYTFYNKDDNGQPYSVQFSYEAQPGKVIFRVTFSNFLTGSYYPKNADFRMLLIW